jgi:hypothetical protein
MVKSTHNDLHCTTQTTQWSTLHHTEKDRALLLTTKEKARHHSNYIWIKMSYIIQIVKTYVMVCVWEI